MYGKIQESGLIEIILLICILTIYSQYPDFHHSEFPPRCTVAGAATVADGLLAGNVPCLLEWKAKFFVY